MIASFLVPTASYSRHDVCLRHNPRWRRRRVPERELLDRLQKYEDLLRLNKIRFEPIHNDATIDKELLHTEGDYDSNDEQSASSEALFAVVRSDLYGFVRHTKFTRRLWNLVPSVPPPQKRMSLWRWKPGLRTNTSGFGIRRTHSISSRSGRREPILLNIGSWNTTRNFGIRLSNRHRRGATPSFVTHSTCLRAMRNHELPS